MSELEIKTVELGYHRNVLTINGHLIGPERQSVCEFDEVRAWLKELPNAELLPFLDTVREAIDDDDAGEVNIHETQNEVAEWASRNFGNTPAYRPLLGMIEELGEICATFSNIAQVDDPAHLLIRACAYLGKMCHARLKMEQGIRGTKEEHEHNLYLNAAYLLVVFRNLFTSNSITVANMSTALSLGNFDKTDTICDGLGDLFVYACDFSNRIEIDMENAIYDTWAKVKQRDWQKNNKTGDVWNADNYDPIADMAKINAAMSVAMGNPVTEKVEGTDTYKHTFTSPE